MGGWNSLIFWFVWYSFFLPKDYDPLFVVSFQYRLSSPFLLDSEHSRGRMTVLSPRSGGLCCPLGSSRSVGVGRLVPFQVWNPSSPVDFKHPVLSSSLLTSLYVSFLTSLSSPLSLILSFFFFCLYWTLVRSRETSGDQLEIRCTHVFLFVPVSFLSTLLGTSVLP